MNVRQARLPCLAPGNVSPDEGIEDAIQSPILECSKALIILRHNIKLSRDVVEITPMTGNVKKL
jgi:hypothetical protein